MNELTAFLDMGGYAGFVWPAYLVAAAVLVGLALQARRELSQRRRTLALLEPKPGRADARASGR